MKPFLAIKSFIIFLVALLILLTLVLLSGPYDLEVISDCASTQFSWSPTGDMLAYVAALDWINLGVDETCLGTYLLSLPGGISQEEWGWSIDYL